MKLRNLALVSAALFLFAGAAFSSDFTAQVVSVSGKAEVLNGDGWKPLSAGDTLKSGDIVQTGFKSGAVLKIKESTVNVAALTRMTVEQLSENQDKDDVRVFVKTGKVSSNVQKTNGKKVGFTVRTPVATASVRGTEFSVENTFSATQVQTKRGKVAVWSGKNSENVSSGEKGGNNSEQTQKNGENQENSKISFENAPHGALTVTQNQRTELGNSGNVRPQQKEAENSSKNIGNGTSPQSGAGKSKKQNEPDVSTRNSYASLSVNISIEN